MTLALDIADVLDDLGTPILILRDSGNISGEYILAKSNSQATKPEIIEFEVKGIVKSDSQVVVGDIIQMSSTSRMYLIMNKNPDDFEGASFVQNVVGYKCNILSGELQRVSGEISGLQTYHRETTWVTIKGNLNACLTSKLFGDDILQKEKTGQLEVDALNLYLPHSLGAQPLDRVVDSASGKYYKVENVNPWNYSGVDRCSAVEDNR